MLFFFFFYSILSCSEVQKSLQVTEFIPCFLLKKQLLSDPAKGCCSPEFWAQT